MLLSPWYPIHALLKIQFQLFKGMSIWQEVGKTTDCPQPLASQGRNWGGSNQRAVRMGHSRGGWQSCGILFSWYSDVFRVPCVPKEDNSGHKWKRKKHLTLKNKCDRLIKQGIPVDKARGFIPKWHGFCCCCCCFVFSLCLRGSWYGVKSYEVFRNFIFCKELVNILSCFFSVGTVLFSYAIDTANFCQHFRPQARWVYLNMPLRGFPQWRLLAQPHWA